MVVLNVTYTDLSLLHCEIKIEVVYHLHGQTRRSTVWVNGKQNSGLVNFIQVYYLYNSIPFAKKRPRKPETDIKDGFKEMEDEFPFGTFHPEKQTTFSDVLLLPEILRRNDPKGRVPFTFPPDFPETLSKC